MPRQPASPKFSVVVGCHSFLGELRANPVLADGVELSFNESYAPINTAFRPMVQALAFDFCEMAVATYVQARARGIPVSLLPVSLMGQFQHGELVVDAERGPSDVSRIIGSRVGARSYSQTTGVWLRSILRTQYGIDPGSIQWIVREGSHVEGFANPPNVVMGPPGKDLLTLLRDGDVSAVVGSSPSNPNVRPLFETPGWEAKRWFEDNGYVPVNHVLTVAGPVLARNPDAVRVVYERVRDAVQNRGALDQGTLDPQWAWTAEVDLLPTRLDDLVPILRHVADEAHRQGLVPRQLARAELVHPLVEEWV